MSALWILEVIFIYFWEAYLFKIFHRITTVLILTILNLSSNRRKDHIMVPISLLPPRPINPSSFIILLKFIQLKSTSSMSNVLHLTEPLYKLVSDVEWVKLQDKSLLCGVVVDHQHPLIEVDRSIYCSC